MQKNKLKEISKLFSISIRKFLYVANVQSQYFIIYYIGSSIFGSAEKYIISLQEEYTYE